MKYNTAVRNENDGLIPQYTQCDCPFGDPHFTGSSVLPTQLKIDIDSYGL
jgi:hypothetical protein